MFMSKRKWLFGEAEKIAVALSRSMTMDSRFISHLCSLGITRRSAAMRPTLLNKRSVWPINIRGFKGHRLDFISVRNANIFRMQPHLCVSSSLTMTEGGSDQIAGSKHVIADYTCAHCQV